MGREFCQEHRITWGAPARARRGLLARKRLSRKDAPAGGVEGLANGDAGRVGGQTSAGMGEAPEQLEPLRGPERGILARREGVLVDRVKFFERGSPKWKSRPRVADDDDELSVGKILLIPDPRVGLMASGFREGPLNQLLVELQRNKCQKGRWHLLGEGEGLLPTETRAEAHLEDMNMGVLGEQLVNTAAGEIVHKRFFAGTRRRVAAFIEALGVKSRGAVFGDDE